MAASDLIEEQETALLASHIKGTSQLVRQHGGTLVTVTISASYLSGEAYQNIRDWWKGEISGRRCAKNMVDTLARVGGAWAGGSVGAVLLTPLGPVGTLVGGMAGAIAGGKYASYLSDALTRKLFDLPKSVALESAYIFLAYTTRRTTMTSIKPTGS